MNTYRGHPVAVSNIEIILEEELPERPATTGAYLIKGLTATLFKHAICSDARGRGLLTGIELMTDRESKTQLDDALIGEARHCNTIVSSPPFVITRSECDALIEVLDEAPGEVAKTVR